MGKWAGQNDSDSFTDRGVKYFLQEMAVVYFVKVLKYFFMYHCNIRGYCIVHIGVVVCYIFCSLYASVPGEKINKMVFRIFFLKSTALF